MKKTNFTLLTLLVVTSFFVGCSGSDDDNSNNFETDLYGKWYYNQRIINGVDSLNDCDRTSYSNIKEDGTFETTHYRKINGECTNDDVISGEWKQLRNNEFTIVGKSEVLIKLINNKKYELYLTDEPNYKEVWIKK